MNMNRDMGQNNPRNSRFAWVSRRGLLLLFLLCGLARVASAEALYVNAQAPAGGDGGSWATAKQTISSALDESTTGTQIWVAAGVYQESIQMKGGVEIYGGFAGNETSLEQRDIPAHPSILDAHTIIGTVYHIVKWDRVRQAVLDGFTISGMPPWEQTNPSGAIYCNQVDESNLLSNCSIVDNSLRSSNSGLSLNNSSLRVSRCRISNNRPLELGYGYFGGGLLIKGGAPVFNNCIISNNEIACGGGIYCDHANAVFINCQVMDNKGNGVYIDGGSVDFRQCKIIGNSGPGGNYGGGVYVNGATLNLQQCWILANSTGYKGGGIYAQAAQLQCTESIISGNVAFYDEFTSWGYREWGQGAGIACIGSSLKMVNCLMSGNRASTKECGGLLLSASSAELANCTFTQNTNSAVHMELTAQAAIRRSIFNDSGGYAIYDAASARVLTLDSCLFFNNRGGDYYDDRTASGVSGAARLNLLAGCQANLDGDPCLKSSLAGVWAEAPVYNPTTNRSTFKVLDDSFSTGSLVGRLITPSMNLRQQTLVTSNTATMVEVVGDFHGLTVSHDAFLFVDNHPAVASAAIDALTSGTATDLDGRPRPVDITGHGADSTGTEFDVGAYEATAENGPVLRLTTANGDTLDFGHQDLNDGPTTWTQTLLITNIGDTPLHFSGQGISLQGPDAGAFSLVEMPSLEALEPGTSRRAQVKFDPSRLGLCYAWLSVTTNDPAQSSVLVPLRGTGSLPPPIMKDEPELTSGTTNTVYWTAVPGVAGYTVEMCEENLFYDIEKQIAVSADTLEQRFDSLWNETYWYRVRSDYGDGSYSSWSAPVHSCQDNVSPWFFIDSVAPNRPLHDDDIVTITFRCGERLRELHVTVNGREAEIVGGSPFQPGDGVNFKSRYQITSADPPGFAPLVITGYDLAGNCGITTATTTIAPIAKAGTIYVDSRADEGGDGSTWTKARKSIAIAMDRAAPGNAIWVAAGIYRDPVSFKTGVQLYGGFRGTEQSLAERTGYYCSSTIIDVSRPSSSYSVPHAMWVSAVKDIVLDGFTFMGAYASRCEYHGGGLICANVDQSNRISNCIIVGNQSEVSGAGVCLLDSSLQLSDCVIINNSYRTNYSNKGAGIYVQGGNPVFTRCVISGNAADFGGGGIYCQDSGASFVNCSIRSNTATDRGSAIYLNNSDSLFNYCTLTGNRGGGSVVSSYDDQGTSMTNCLFDDHLSTLTCPINQTPSIKMISCLLGSHASAVYQDNNVAYGDATSANQNLPGWRLNQEGRAHLATGVDGFWTEDPLYDPDTRLTTLRVAGSPFASGSLVSQCIKPSLLLKTESVITSNTSNTVQVFGDLTNKVHRYDMFRLVSEVPGYGSQAIDSASADCPTTTDQAGVLRPIDIPNQGADANGQEFDIGAREASVATAPKVIIQITTGTLNFGSQVCEDGPSPPLSISFTNLGYSTLDLSALTISGPDASDFQTSTPLTTLALSPGQSHRIQVTFDPSRLGPRVAYLECNTSDPNHPKISLPLLGRGLLSTPKVLAEPAYTSGTANTIFWQPVPGATGYTVQCSYSDNFGSIKEEKKVDAATQQATFTGLDYEWSYWYRVRTQDITGEPSRWSDPVCSIQDKTPPTLNFWPSTSQTIYSRSTTLTLSFSEILASSLTPSDILLTGTLSQQAMVSIISNEGGYKYVLRIDISPSTPAGTVGIQVRPGLLDKAGNPFAGASSALMAVGLGGTIIIHPLNEPAMGWTLLDIYRSHTQLSGQGVQRIANLIPGNYVLFWTKASGYVQPAPRALALHEGETIEINEIFVPVGQTAASLHARILGYLLGLQPYADDLDQNHDGRVDVADLELARGSLLPIPPASPDPADGKTTVSLAKEFHWSPCSHARAYDLYLWESGKAQPTTPVAKDLQTNAWRPAGLLEGLTNYCWSVVAKNTRVQTAGPTWTFRTEVNPVHVISPNGGQIWPRGQQAQVHWKTVVKQAGTAVRLELWRQGARVATLGESYSDVGETTRNVLVPKTVESSNDYKIRAISTWLEKQGAPVCWDESDGMITLQ